MKLQPRILIHEIRNPRRNHFQCEKWPRADVEGLRVADAPDERQGLADLVESAFAGLFQQDSLGGQGHARLAPHEDANAELFFKKKRIIALSLLFFFADGFLCFSCLLCVFYIQPT